MRTLQQLHEALKDVNVQEVARRSGVNAKTVYRIRQQPDWPVSAKSAEAINAAIDTLSQPIAEATADAQG